MRDGALIFHTEGVFSYPGYGRMLVARVILSYNWMRSQIALMCSHAEGA